MRFMQTSRDSSMQAQRIELMRGVSLLLMLTCVTTGLHSQTEKSPTDLVDVLKYAESDGNARYLTVAEQTALGNSLHWFPVALILRQGYPVESKLIDGANRQLAVIRVTWNAVRDAPNPNKAAYNPSMADFTIEIENRSTCHLDTNGTSIGLPHDPISVVVHQLDWSSWVSMNERESGEVKRLQRSIAFGKPWVNELELLMEDFSDWGVHTGRPLSQCRALSQPPLSTPKEPQTASDLFRCAGDDPLDNALDEITGANGAMDGKRKRCPDKALVIDDGKPFAEEQPGSKITDPLAFLDSAPRPKTPSVSTGELMLSAMNNFNRQLASQYPGGLNSTSFFSQIDVSGIEQCQQLESRLSQNQSDVTGINHAPRTDMPRCRSRELGVSPNSPEALLPLCPEGNHNAATGSQNDSVKNYQASIQANRVRAAIDQCYVEARQRQQEYERKLAAINRQTEVFKQVTAGLLNQTGFSKTGSDELKVGCQPNLGYLASSLPAAPDPGLMQVRQAIISGDLPQMIASGKDQGMTISQMIDASNRQVASDRQSMDQAATCIMQTSVQGKGDQILAALRARNYSGLSIGGNDRLSSCIGTYIAADWGVIASQEAARQLACYSRAP
jgi:hypothetical protein